MHLTTLLPLGLASVTIAQSTMSLSAVLTANNKTLSTLNGISPYNENERMN
jgi:hypothetical protein